MSKGSCTSQTDPRWHPKQSYFRVVVGVASRGSLGCLVAGAGELGDSKPLLTLLVITLLYRGYSRLKILLDSATVTEVVASVIEVTVSISHRQAIKASQRTTTGGVQGW